MDEQDNNNDDDVKEFNYFIYGLIFSVIFIVTIIMPLLNSYTYHINQIGAITSITPDYNSFKIDNSNYYSCNNVDVNSLHINEIVHYKQTHDYMFPNSNIQPFKVTCNLTVIQP